MDLKLIKPSVQKAVMLARREISVFVHDAVLEGINFTLPEIQNLLKGVTLSDYPNTMFSIRR